VELEPPDEPIEPEDEEPEEPDEDPPPSPPLETAEPVDEPVVFGRDPACPAQAGARLSVKAAATAPMVNF
jgi:hypothetical protein